MHTFLAAMVFSITLLFYTDGLNPTFLLKEIRQPQKARGRRSYEEGETGKQLKSLVTKPLQSRE